MIDNYDSFTYNLVQYLGELGEEVRVFRNDRVGVDEIAALAPAHIVISPGPCTPAEAGIGEVFGGKVVRAERLMHGKTSLIHHDGKGLFDGVPNPFEATRYHSLIIERDSMPDDLELTAWTDAGEIMGVRHKRFAVEGVQFHPESILTRVGHDLLRNFLKLTGGLVAEGPAS
jgi:anthranilate/para-aminobenzoate synthase component II